MQNGLNKPIMKILNLIIALVFVGQIGCAQKSPRVQADGSIGSMLSLASQKLSAGDYDKFAGMIPGADKYLESAKSLGAVAEPLASLGDFNSALSSLGISPETIEKYVPMITEYVGKLGGDDATKLLSQLFG